MMNYCMKIIECYLFHSFAYINVIFTSIRTVSYNRVSGIFVSFGSQLLRQQTTFINTFSLFFEENKT